MDKVTQQFDCFFQELTDNHLSRDEIKQICLQHLRDSENKKNFENIIQNGGIIRHPERLVPKGPSKARKVCLWVLLPALVAILACSLGVLVAFDKDEIYDVLSELLKSPSPCLLDHNEITSEVTRPVFNCSICKGMRTVPVERELTRERFEEIYGYRALPVLVKGSSNAWQARDIFSFEFLKSLYESHNGSLDMVEEQCQFFGYNTNFKTLAEVFNMSKDMSDLKLQKWYVGWSNCVPAIETELRKHYQKPAFLPEDSVSSHLDWIFMGGWGYGAPVHLDNVGHPSWQAQLSGKKTWILIPPPECESVCHNLQVTMYTGDIIVVDTNQWFHSTYIHPGQISITIGSEYD